MSDIAQNSEPFHWIQLELLPLPHCQDEFSKLLLWWNPEERKIIGDNAQVVLDMIHKAEDKGSSGPGESVELNDPLSKPTELAAILGQYFWVVPQPVKTPGEVSNTDSESHHLQ